jgi:energy-coupling factor transport system substrate-specific component
MLAAYGALTGLVYGLVMNMWFWPFSTTGATDVHFIPGASVVSNLGRFWAFHLSTSLGFDLPQAVGNFALVMVAGTPVLAALRRAHRRAAFGAPIVFEPA